jgi:S-methylmethionine-dependent homocysteine/selenocysteine methylase
MQASELEHLGFQMPTADPWPNLWSSSALISDHDLVKQVHRRYLDAGATVLSTCTYQLSLEAVASPEQAQIFMERAITAVNDIALQSTAPCLKLLSLGPCAVIHPSGTEVSNMSHMKVSLPQSRSIQGSISYRTRHPKAERWNAFTFRGCNCSPRLIGV